MSKTRKGKYDFSTKEPISTSTQFRILTREAKKIYESIEDLKNKYDSKSKLQSTK